MAKYKKRTDGRYISRVPIGKDEDGKTVYKVVLARSVAELELAITAAKEEAGAGDFSGATMAEWLAAWLKIKQHEVDTDEITETTYDSYEEIVRLHLTPSIGPIALRELTPTNIRSLLKKKANGGLSGRRVQYIYVVLNMALTVAENDRTILWNPARPVKKPVATKREYFVITSEQYAAITQAAKECGLETLTAVAWDSGLRLGELMGLTWKCIDFKAHTIDVKQTVRRTKASGIHISPDLKSDSGRRTVPLSKKAAAALQIHKKEQAKHRLSFGLKYNSQFDLVFPQQDGYPQNPDNASSKWSAMKKKLDLPEGLHFHDIRHTYASTLAEMDVHPKKMQLLLGHSTSEFTLSTYAHKTENMFEGIKEKLDARDSAPTKGGKKVLVKK